MSFVYRVMSMVVGCIIGDLVAALFGHGTWNVINWFSVSGYMTSGGTSGIGEFFLCMLILLFRLAWGGIGVAVFITGIAEEPKSAWFIPIGTVLAYIIAAYPYQFGMGIFFAVGIPLALFLGFVHWIS